MKTKNAKIWLRDDGIIQIEASTNNTEGTVANARENMTVAFQLGKGIKRPILLNISKTKSLSREERQYYISGETAKVLTAVAIIINSPLSRILGNFFIGLNKPAFPLKLFVSEEEAVTWLKGFIE